MSASGDRAQPRGVRDCKQLLTESTRCPNKDKIKIKARKIKLDNKEKYCFVLHLCDIDCLHGDAIKIERSK